MAIIGIFLDRRVSVDLARAISVILQVTFIVASAKRNDGPYQDEKGTRALFLKSSISTRQPASLIEPQYVSMTLEEVSLAEERQLLREFARVLQP